MAHRKGLTKTALVHKNFMKQLKQFKEKIFKLTHFLTNFRFEDFS